MKSILVLLALFTLSAHADDYWVPQYTCDGFEIDYLHSSTGNDPGLEQTVIRGQQVIATLQTLVGDTPLMLETDGSLIIADTGQGFKGNVDADLVHKLVSKELDIIYQVHGHPVRDSFELAVTRFQCTPTACEPKPGPELGRVTFKNCHGI